MPDNITIGKYEILEPLGEGATAVVYLARDTALGREVALKVLKPHLAGDADMFKYFLREAQTAARLHHPRIAPIYDMGESGGRFFIAMHRVEGLSLNKILRQQGALGVEEALAMAADVAAALDYAHKRGFLHRDVKPANVIRDENGEYILTDFGLARALNMSGLTSTNTAVPGTLAYIAPEVWNQQALTPAVDQYALACVIYEAIDGNTLFQGEPAAIMASHLVRAPEFRPSFTSRVPPAFTAALRRALDKEPANRYPSNAALVNALRAALRDPEEAPAPLPFEAAPPVESALVEPQTQPEQQPAEPPPAFEQPLGIEPAGTPPVTVTRNETAIPPALRAEAEPAQKEILSAAVEDLPVRSAPVVTAAATHAPQAEPPLVPEPAEGSLAAPTSTGRFPLRFVLIFAVLLIGIVGVFALERYREQVAGAEEQNGGEEVPGGEEVTDGEVEPAYGRLAFQSDRDGTYVLYTMNADGSEQHWLAETHSSIEKPVWSPDGNWIALNSDVDGNENIYVISADGESWTQLTDYPGKDVRPQWTADSSHVVFFSYDEDNGVIYINAVHRDGSDFQTIYEITTWFVNPQISPVEGDQRLVARRDDDGDPEIYVLEGDNWTRLTDNDAIDDEPAWSYDGSQIVFMSERDGNAEIYVMDADGSNVRRLTENDAWDGLPSWSPDGSFIAFTSNRNGNNDIFIVDADGSNERQITSEESYEWNPVWSPVW